MKGLEIEWQFEAAALPLVENWLRDHAADFGFALARAATHDQTDIYLDTDDWRCYRAGYALRLRRVTTAEGVEAAFKGLKRASEAEAGPLRRLEISERLADGDLDTLYGAPGEVGQRVRILTGASALRPIFALQTHRDTLKLERDTALAAEVALDETRILMGPGKEPVRLRRVEVESAAEPSPELEALVAALQQAGDLEAATLSKYETALAAHDLKPTLAPDLGSTVIDASVTVGALAWAVMRRHMAAMVAHEPGTRLGEDPEALHDMRVAARRLRAALSLFADCLPARAQHFRAELKWVAAELGVVRDLDVQLERVQTWQAEAGAADQAVFEPLQAVLEEQRQHARKRLLRLLNSHRYQRLEQGYAAFLWGGPPKRHSHPAQMPALEAAPSLIADCYRQAREAGDGISASSAPEAYHALRIRSKRLRYAVEFAAPLYGEAAQELARNITALQDLLGLHQDAQVAIAQLRALSQTYSRRLPPETIFAMGEMTQRYAQLMIDCRQRFIHVYAGVRGKSWKRLRQVMGGHQPASASAADAS
jgi:triphosphatase